MARDEGTVQVGGRRIRISNLGKVLYPSTGTTKGEVIGYYSAIAETMLPHCRDRPATRKRWPDGVGPEGDRPSFFQKDIGDHAPEWVQTRDIAHRTHVNAYPLVNDEATLVWLAQLAALEIHVPQWRFTETGEPSRPDRIVFDLDPGEGVPLADCAGAAFLVRDILRGMGLPVVPVTSGSAGIHLYAGLDGSVDSAQASALAKELARSLEADHPDSITSSMRRSLRPGKVFIDWSQNNAAKTTVAPYSLRGRTRPTVAAPRTWRELGSPHLRQLEFHEALERVERRGDPLALLLAGEARSPVDERLTEYRAKRDAARTPEPVPTIGEGAERDDEQLGRPRFVIQRHQARRLHYDFRLEHAGVLVSWALPKGVPTDASVNHLAVPTEDHPMSYRHFEGTIPRGEYGAGDVRIWDSGTYELEKWRDDEVIVTLTGRDGGGLGGVRRFALFRAGESDGKPRWMIHLMAAAARVREPDRPPAARVPEPERPPAGSDRDDAPMLAETGSFHRLPRLDGAEWAFEMKWDGIRALAFVEGETVRLRSRSGADLTDAYPELSSLSGALNCERAVLDGEIIALDDRGVPSFSRLQRRFGVTDRRRLATLRKEVPASFVVFDVLQINGNDCRALPYAARRALLETLVEPRPRVPIAVPEPGPDDPQHALDTSRALGLEGIIAKRRTSPYRSGERSDDWLKFPLIHTDEAVVIGWRASEAEPRGFASLLLAERSEGGLLRYAGRVGTGFSASERREIRTRLEDVRSESPPVEVPAEIRRDARWVHPVLVGEVTSKGRTESGSFRQPVWRGWRPDKRV